MGHSSHTRGAVVLLLRAPRGAPIKTVQKSPAAALTLARLTRRFSMFLAINGSGNGSDFWTFGRYSARPKVAPAYAERDVRRALGRVERLDRELSKIVRGSSRGDPPPTINLAECAADFSSYFWPAGEGPEAGCQLSAVGVQARQKDYLSARALTIHRALAFSLTEMRVAKKD